MNFFFYTNKNLLFAFLGRNLIAPDIIIKDIKRDLTISTESENLLFVTHKKLGRKSREKGIAQPELVYPITLEFSDAQDSDAHAVLVSKTGGGYDYKLDSLYKYNPQNHVGAYIMGEIPLSRVSKIYFDTQEDMDGFSRPSPDYWYPISKYGLLPGDFEEELFIEHEVDRITEASTMNRDEITKGIRIREKKRAGILNFINATQRWQYDKYIFNMDSNLQKLYGLEDAAISETLPHYLEARARDKENVEKLLLELGGPAENNGFNQVIYNTIYHELLLQPYNTKKQPELIVKILNCLDEKLKGLCPEQQMKMIVDNTIKEIKELVLDSSNKGPDEILSKIAEPTDSLKALLFVVKNPNRYDLFLNSLEAYHADLLTKRRACVLWGVLNGLYGMPGDGFNKDNIELWQFIEAKIYEGEKESKPSLSVSMPMIILVDNKILGTPLKEERIVTAKEVREFILAIPKERLKESFYRKLLDAVEVELGGKKKAEDKGYAQRVASINIPEIKVGDKLDAITMKYLETLIKDYKSPLPNKDKLYQDYLKSEDGFDFVFYHNSSYWKSMYKKVTEKENGEEEL